MAVDIGTGVIQIEINRAQLRREAVQASRALARTPTRFVPQLDTRRMAGQLQAALRGIGPEAWRPLQAGGVQAMQAVGASGVAAMNAVEVRGLAAAARLRVAFAAATAVGGAAFAPRAPVQAPLAPRAPVQQRVQGGGGLTAGRLFAADFGSEVISQAGPIGAAAGQALGGGLHTAVIAASALAVNAVYRRFQRFGGFQGFRGGGGAATRGNLFEALGLRDEATAESLQADRQRIAGAALVGDASGDAALALEALAREARNTATAQQRARARRDAPAPEPRQPRQRQPSFFESPGRILGSALLGPLGPAIGAAATEIYNRRVDRLNAEEAELEAAGTDTVNATQEERDAAREAARIREGIATLNEQRIEALARGVAEQRIETDLLTGTNAQSRRYQQEFGNQRIEAARRTLAEQRIEADLLTQRNRQARRFQRLSLEGAVASRRGGIFQQRQEGAINRRLIFGDSGLRLSERLGVAMQSVTGALSTWGTAIAIAAVATYAVVRAITALARRSEELAAAQIAAGSIAQRTLGAGDARITGAAVDIGAVAGGIRAGAAGGLSELTVARTAIDAIRTGSEDIFLNTEQVLTDLRVVAAATGVAFEDATTRFFRGIIKREQELLDELGIVARVEAANARYARSINVATSALTPFQQQLAFAEEVQRQLTISAQNFGTEQVLATQRATEASNRLGAVWSNLFADLGAQTRGISEAFSAIGIGIAAAVRFNLGIRRQETPEVQVVSNLNRLEAERNRLISERLGLISQAALQGTLDINQQRSLLQLTQELPAQQAQIFGPGGVGAPGPQFSAGNIAQASANVTELNGAIRNLADARSRTRIAALQGPLAALLTSLEGGGRVAALSAEAYQDLTRGTAESEEAIRLLATVFNRSVPEVRALIEANQQLEVVRQRETESIRDTLRLANEALRFGPALRENFDALGQGLTAGVQTFRELIPATTDLAAPSLDAAGIRERAPIARTPLELDLTVTDRLSLAASEVGLTLDTMSSNFSRFAEDLLFESNSIRDALQAFIRNIAQTVVRSQATNLGNELFGSLGLTNVGAGTGGGTTYNTFQNIGIANPLQARNAGFQAAALEGIGI